MKIKTLLATVILLAVCAGVFAQEGDYVGNWSNARAWELSFDGGKLYFKSRDNPAENLKYRDITPAGSETFHLEITGRKKDSYFSGFAAVTFASFDEMTITFYKTLADMKAGKNAEFSETWLRDGTAAGGELIDVYAGELQVGKTESVILYVGMETGDYAAYCFKNNTEMGKKILAACKDGEQCEVTGEIDGKACKVPGLEADLSFSGTFTSVISAKSAGKDGETEMTADMHVKSLYDAQEKGNSPFFQNKDRALVDRYFAKDFADLIWQDAAHADGEAGVINFDPLYDAQDTDIKDFKIGKPETGTGLTTVEVTFKNFGKKQNIRYLLEQDANKSWKITDIRYSSGDMLKGILYAALNDQN